MLTVNRKLLLIINQMLVELITGLEPATYWLQVSYSTNWVISADKCYAYTPDSPSRTTLQSLRYCDYFLAPQRVMAIFSPFGIVLLPLHNILFKFYHKTYNMSILFYKNFGKTLATPTGFEPVVSGVTGRRDNQLRHRAIMVEPMRFELMTSCLQGRRSSNWTKTPKYYWIRCNFLSHI